MDSLLWIQQFHLIRPYWLLALFPLALCIWLYSRTQIHSRNWASVIDKRLLPHLLQGVTEQKKSKSIISLFLPLFVIGFIIIFALAGPAFEKRPQPVFKTQSALVILLDLSRSMDATDIKPSRLSRAHFKINDILDLRKEGQTALIAYAANAYTVSPLTDDADTIASQIPALETHIMPAQGSRLDIALDKALALFNNAGHSRGDILVITDSINSNDQHALKRLSSKNFKTSILAIGTTEGAPIASKNGGFVKDSSGSIVVPKLDVSHLKSAALSSGGKFSLLTSNDNDITHLLSSIDINRDAPKDNQSEENALKFKTDTWHEEGPWLLLLVIPFAAYAFRKGLIFVLLIFILPLPQPAQAFGWSDLWSNNNQQGKAALQQGNIEQAAELFNNPEWKSAAQYKAGEYQQSADLLKNIDTADANYNRGNALAKTGNLQAAIKAYDRTLEIDSQHEDAKFNKQLLKKAQQDKKDQEKNSDEDKRDDQNSDSKDKQDQNESGEQSENQDSSQNDSQNDSQENSQQQSEKDDKNNKSDSENKQKNNEEKESEAEQKEASESENDQKNKEENQASQPLTESEDTPDLEKQQTQQWLKKIPDDPGGLLRRKFKYQYSREQNQNEKNPW
ncbi:MAG: hypothetical protein DIZ80_16110 [endosymbiont of Galathealinum brachiosum]|uniref:VWFA domain-containing protein n=1 Tax=endosymbiont of Galathealinum brachiosum TaxID=2200906 RepID=A0A370D9K7_9GAMM|nr:MAG: hypothetical protein DIZ80_16110 [endosymbiont of Galathealinum brachiosum]